MTYSQALEQVRTAIYGKDVREALVFLFENYGTKLTIGTVKNGDTASASIETGKLNLVLPKGDKGEKGEPGLGTQDAVDAAKEAQEALKTAQEAARTCKQAAESITSAATSAENDANTAKTAAGTAMAAAERAEKLAPETVVASVNKKTGAVVLTAADVGALASGSNGYVKNINLQNGTLAVTLGDGTTANMTPYTLTAYGINTALGYDLTSTLTEMKGKIGMHEKLVLTLSCSAGHNTSTVSIPDVVDYLVVRMLSPAVDGNSANNGIAVSAEYGMTRIIRNGSAIATIKSDHATGDITSQMYFTNGTLSIGGHTDMNNYAFNLEGYQYV